VAETCGHDHARRVRRGWALTLAERIRAFSVEATISSSAAGARSSFPGSFRAFSRSMLSASLLNCLSGAEAVMKAPPSHGAISACAAETDRMRGQDACFRCWRCRNPAQKSSCMTDDLTAAGRIKEQSAGHISCPPEVQEFQVEAVYYFCHLSDSEASRRSFLVEMQPTEEVGMLARPATCAFGRDRFPPTNL